MNTPVNATIKTMTSAGSLFAQTFNSFVDALGYKTLFVFCLCLFFGFKMASKIISTALKKSQSDSKVTQEPSPTKWQISIVHKDDFDESKSI